MADKCPKCGRWCDPPVYRQDIDELEYICGDGSRDPGIRQGCGYRWFERCDDAEEKK